MTIDYELGTALNLVQLPQIIASPNCGEDLIVEFEQLTRIADLDETPLDQLVTFDQDSNLFTIMPSDKISLNGQFLRVKLNLQVNEFPLSFVLRINYFAGPPKFVKAPVVPIMQTNKINEWRVDLPQVFAGD